MNPEVTVFWDKSSECLTYLHHLLLDERPDLGEVVELLIAIDPRQVLHAAVRLQLRGVQLENRELEETAVGADALHDDGLLQNPRLVLQETRDVSVKC